MVFALVHWMISNIDCHLSVNIEAKMSFLEVTLLVNDVTFFFPQRGLIRPSYHTFTYRST